MLREVVRRKAATIRASIVQSSSSAADISRLQQALTSSTQSERDFEQRLQSVRTSLSQANGDTQALRTSVRSCNTHAEHLQRVLSCKHEEMVQALSVRSDFQNMLTRQLASHSKALEDLTQQQFWNRPLLMRCALLHYRPNTWALQLLKLGHNYSESDKEFVLTASNSALPEGHALYVSVLKDSHLLAHVTPTAQGRYKITMINRRDMVHVSARDGVKRVRIHDEVIVLARRGECSLTVWLLLALAGT